MLFGSIQSSLKLLETILRLIMQTIGVRNRVHYGVFENRELSVCFGSFLSHQGHFLVSFIVCITGRPACFSRSMSSILGLKSSGLQVLRIEIIIANLPFQKIYITNKIDTDRHKYVTTHL